MKLLTIVGARPNFMKAAPLDWAVGEWNASGRGAIEHLLVHTGQHYDVEMSGVFFEGLRLPQPAHNLGIGSGTQAEQVGRALIELEKVLLSERPDWVVVVGDVNATVSAALAAKKIGLKVAHIEAGLRSHDWTMPEEINRVVVDRLSDLLLATGEMAAANLYKEGIEPERVVTVGNIMIDTLDAVHACANPPSDKGDSPYAVLTLHRPSNVDRQETLAPLLACLAGISRELPIRFPIHPRTRSRLECFGLGEYLNGSFDIRPMEPQGYTEMLGLMAGASFVFTDSGGIQEEATVLGVPCITLRFNTERPETLLEHGGTALLAGNDPARIIACYRQLRDNPPKGSRPPLWDGLTSGRIIDALWERRNDPPHGTGHVSSLF